MPGAWIAIARDGSGQAVEVHPDGMAHHPGEGDVDPTRTPDGPGAMPWEDQIYPDGRQLRASAFHFAMSTHLSQAQGIELARAAGLRTLACERGGVFGVVEVWLDDVVLLEVLCGGEIERHRRFMNPEGVAGMFGEGVRPPAVRGGPSKR